MNKLPVISGRKLVKILKEVGFEFRRQKGSHIILQNSQSNQIVSVPDHKILDRGTLRAIIRQVSLSVKEFSKLYNSK